jgi:hypothetical protein
MKLQSARVQQSRGRVWFAHRATTTLTRRETLWCGFAIIVETGLASWKRCLSCGVADRRGRIAQVLDAPVGVFFDGGPNERKEAQNDHSPLALLSEPQALRVARAFLRIANPDIRKSCMKLVEKLAEDRKTHRRQT